MEEILQRMLEAHRLMRHDYMNHLQIISGYLQLGQPEKVREYIKKVSGSLDRFIYLARIEAPFLQSLLLYYLVTLGENDCFNLEVKDKISLKKKDDRSLTLLVRELIAPFYESILSNELKCKLDIKEPSLIEISLWGADRIIEACSTTMKQLDGLLKSRHDYSLVVTKRSDPNGNIYLYINIKRSGGFNVL